METSILKERSVPTRTCLQTSVNTVNEPCLQNNQKEIQHVKVIGRLYTGSDHYIEKIRMNLTL